MSKSKFVFSPAQRHPFIVLLGPTSKKAIDRARQALADARAQRRPEDDDE